ncbi:Semaphorin-3D [Manis pentadactyla]|nr:Semaphorin-3D [Manis pentadactyla]
MISASIMVNKQCSPHSVPLRIRLKRDGHLHIIKSSSVLVLSLKLCGKEKAERSLGPTDSHHVIHGNISKGRSLERRVAGRGRESDAACGPSFSS